MSSYGVVGRVGVLVEPRMTGVQRKVRDGLGKPLAQEGPRQGRNLGDSIVAGTTRVFKWGGVAVGAALGTALTKGFQRVAALEDATAKIEGLGYSAKEVDIIMDDVKAGLDRTQYLYSEGADVAAGALAAGVKEGKELEGYLRLTADAATQANVPYSQMGEIMNVVAEKGHLTGDALHRLQQNGVYMSTDLAEHLGVTSDEFSRMVSAGEVSADVFQEVMQDRFGGSAEKAAETMSGAMSLAWTAVGQLGENMIKEFWPYIKDFFVSFYDWAQEVAPAIEEFAGKVGKALGSVIVWLTENPGAVKAFAAAIGAVFAAMAAYTVVVKVQGAIAGLRFAFANLNVVMALNPVAIWVAAIAALVVALVWAWNNVDWFRDAILTAWDWISRAFTTVWENVLEPVFAWFGEAWQWVAAVAVDVWEKYLQPVFAKIGEIAVWLWSNIIEPYVGFILGLWMSLGEVFMWVWENVLSHVFNAIGVVAMWLWEYVLSPVFSWIGDHWQFIVAGMKGVWEYILKPVFNAIGSIAVWLWEKVLSPVFSWIGEHWSSIMDIMSWAWTYILEPVFKAVAFVARWLWDYVLSPVFSFIGAHWSKIVTGMKWAWDHILRPAWDVLVIVATWLWEKVLKKIFTWIGDHWEEILFAMKYIWENHLKPAWERMKSVATWLWEKLSDIFTWIGNKWESMKTKIVDVYNKHIKPVFDKFGDIVTNLKDKFKTGVDNIKKQWNRLKGIAADPVKFVIEDIFNDGLINTLNKIPGVNIPDVPVPKWAKEYADGGWTGPGSRLTPAGLVHADEYVVRKASRGRFERENPGMLDHINKHGTMAGYAKGGLVRPVRGPLTSRFGAGRGRYPHAGVDWAVPVGTPVKAALAGTALGRQPAGRTGRYVFLAHPGNRNTYYGHLSRPMVSAGDEVAKGQVIGLSGNTGRSTGPHLHFETWTGGKPVNPLQYMGGLPESSGGDEGGGWFDPLAPFRALGEKIKSSITDKFPGSGYMIDASAGIAKQGFDSLLDWAKSIIPGLGDPDDGSSGAGAGMGAGSQVVRGQVQSVADQFGWGSGAQWSALSNIIQKESSWNPAAANSSSSARGLFQMIAANRSAPYTDVAGHSREGLNYIKNRYGTPTKALAFHNRNNWYDKGGRVNSLYRDKGGNLPPGLSMVLNKTGRDEAILNSRQWQDIHTLAQRGSGGSGVHIENAYALSSAQLARDIATEQRRSKALQLI